MSSVATDPSARQVDRASPGPKPNVGIRCRYARMLPAIPALVSSSLHSRTSVRFHPVARRARLLNVLTLSLLLGMALFSLSGLVMWLWGGDVDVVLFAGAPGAIAAILVLTYVLVRLGRLRMAVWAFLGLLNVIILVLLLVLGHRSAMPIFIPIAILAVAVLARQRIAFGFAVCWIVAYLVVAIAERGQCVADVGLHKVREDRFGKQYARTLAQWHRRFLKCEGAVADLGFDQTFRRMWKYYLAYCEAGFRLGRIDLAQLLLERE